MTTNDRPVVTRKGQEHGNTGQSGGLKLMSGVGPQHTPATKIWFGKASNPPGFRSLPHHHGEAETGAYVLSGRARVLLLDDRPRWAPWVVADTEVANFPFPSVDAQRARVRLLLRDGYSVQRRLGGYVVLHRPGSVPDLRPAR